MQAIILAGGQGTRLRPYTTIFPKPLMPIGDLPILEIVIRQLKYFGFEKIVIATGSLMDLIQAYFRNGEKWGVKIEYSIEDNPLGTAAPISLINNLEDDFLVMNGDILTDIDYLNFINYHKKENQICTISVFKKIVNIDLGLLQLNNKNCIEDYIEKPTKYYDVSMGIYAFKKEILTYIPKNRYLDFPDLIRKLIKDNKTVKSYPFNGRWLDIGRPEDYAIAVEEFDKYKIEFIRQL